MDSYVKTITLDVNADQNYTIVKAKQGDKINRKIAITLKKDGANFTPTGVSEVWFRVEKPDKNIAIVKSTDSGNPISASGNVYTVSLSEQCLTASGKAWCDLAFLDSSGNTLSSCAFIMNIIPMPNGNTAESISEWTDLQKAIDDAERFADIVAFRTSGNYIQYTVDGQTWTNLVNVGAIGGDLQNQIGNLSDLTTTNKKSLVGAANELKGSLTALQSQIVANVETGTTAQKKNYTTGEYVVVDDVLYRVIAPIARYSTFNVGTNIVTVNVGNELIDKMGTQCAIISSITELRYNSMVFRNNTAFAIGSTGVTLPQWSYGIFFTTGNTDASFIAITRNGDVIVADRISDAWILASSVNTRITNVETNVSTLQTEVSTLQTDVSGGTITDITTTNTNFTILNSSTNPSKYIKRGKYVEVNCNVRCETTATGSQAICTLPASLIANTLHIGNWTLYGSPNSIASGLLQNGILYINGATAGNTYAIHFMYMT